PAQGDAVTALGKLGSDRALAALVELAHGSDLAIALAAVAAIGEIPSPVAVDEIRKLVDARDPRIAASALSAVDAIDDAMLAKLGRLVRSGNRGVAREALGALARAGEPGLPVLREAAMRGEPRTRWDAIAAIGEIGGPKATQMLGEILR